MKRSTLIAAFCLLGAAALMAAEQGYLVRVDGSKVYLDYGAQSGVMPGQNFVIFQEGEELIHPITKKSLGRIEKKLTGGTIEEVFPSYSIGRLPKPAKGLKPGARVRLGAVVGVAAAAAPVAQAAPADKDGKRKPRWTSPSFNYKVTGAAFADFDGDGALETALSGGKEVRLYAYPPDSNKPRAKFKHSAVAGHILSLEAADINGNGRAELFVSFFNGSGPRVETVVLELGTNGQWAQVSVEPWVVRGYQDAGGRRVLGTQQLLDDQTFPFSTIYPLVYKAGEYGRGKKAVRPKRVDWIYDFTMVDLGDDKPAVLYHTKTDRIRLQFKKGYWKSQESYNTTPVRLRWKGRILQARPLPQIVYGTKGFQSLYLIHNKARLGGWAKSFGLYRSGELHCKRWDGIGLETRWKSELVGYSTALSLVKNSRGTQELAVVVVGTSQKSAVWIYDL